MSKVLVFGLKWISATFRRRSFLERVSAGTENVSGLKISWLVLASFDICEDAEALCSCLRSWDVLGIKRLSFVSIWRSRHCCGASTIDGTDLILLPVFSDNVVDRIKRVADSVGSSKRI